MDSTAPGPTTEEAMPSVAQDPPSNPESMSVSSGASCGTSDSTPTAADRWNPVGVDWWTPRTLPPANEAFEPVLWDSLESLFNHCGRPEAHPDDGPALPPGVYPMKFDRSSVVVLMDSVESVMKGCDRVIEDDPLRRVLGQYTIVFSRMTSCWKRVVCLCSPDTAFWDVMDRERYDWAETVWLPWHEVLASR